MRVQLFTHTDADGTACAILAAYAYGEISLNVTYCDYHNVNQKVEEYISDTANVADLVLITDISVNESVASKLNIINTVTADVKLLDHHETAEWLNQYPWAEVYFKHANGLNTAGVSMLLEYLFASNELDPEGEGIPGITAFVEQVRRYDTWDWANIYNDIEPKKLNDLFWILGRDRFFEEALESLLKTDQYSFGPTEELILELEQERINRKVNRALKQLTIKNVGRYNIGVVFAEDYQNDIAHYIHDQHPHLDLVAVVSMSSRKVSYRTQREDIDVGKFAKYYGGGGRTQTAGSQLEDFQFELILRAIFGGE